MTIFLTILSGVAVFVLGQTVLKLLIEPVNDMKRTIGEVAFTLLKYSNAYGNPAVVADATKLEKVRSEIRELGSGLLKGLSVVPFYPTTRKWFFLPPEKDVEEAISCLIGLSNSLVVGNPIHISEREKKVFRLLKVYIFRDWKTDIVARTD